MTLEENQVREIWREFVKETANRQAESGGRGEETETDRQTDRQTETNRQTDRQTDRGCRDKDYSRQTYRVKETITDSEEKEIERTWVQTSTEV